MPLHCEAALLLQPLTIRGVTIPNRMMLSPMCQYSAQHGCATDWHLAHLGKFAMGGFGVVCVEATAVSEAGRITHGDLGAWHDGQMPGLKRLADMIRSRGAIPAIQLGHSGRKGSSFRPWHGHSPILESECAGAEPPWQTESVNELPVDGAWSRPRALDSDGIKTVQQAFVDAARRVSDAGYDIVEIHAAHGYLLHSFLSPLTNDRTDEYGGSLENRMRFLVEICQKVRAVLPVGSPMFVRCSVIDDADGGWTMEDTLVLARELQRAGVDAIDCSSGGISRTLHNAAMRVPKGPGFQLPLAERVRAETGCRTVAVGLILTARQAEEALRKGQADLVAIGREALSNPNWALHAARDLQDSLGFDRWPDQYGWWLARRASAMRVAKIDHPDFQPE